MLPIRALDVTAPLSSLLRESMPAVYDIYGHPKLPELMREYEEYLKERLGKP